MDHQEYFDDQRLNSVPEYWRRMGGRPEVAGRRILEIGSGHGAMALDLAERGAHVLGLDLQRDRVEWAKAHVEPRPVAGSLRFELRDVRELAGETFDLIVSKDTFEHITDLAGLLAALRTCLAPGGRIWAGFSPLFYSPWGDHEELGSRVPWAHTVSRRYLLRIATRRHGHPVRSLADVGLNGMTPADFRHAVAVAGLRFEWLGYNVSDKLLMRVLSRARRVPALERFATVSVYTVLAPV